MTDGRLRIYRGSILDVEADAIVNAANKSLLGGGGVDGVIHRAAGPALKEYCWGLGGCDVGDAKLTPAFNLPHKAIIHAVGPIWKGGGDNEAALLARCYARSINLAAENGFSTIVFPAISTGAFSYPVDSAAQIAVQSLTASLERCESIEYAVIACIDRKAETAFQRALRRRMRDCEFQKFS